jgi:hypothetical protein
MQTTHTKTEAEAVKAFRIAILDKIFEEQVALSNEIGASEAKKNNRKADALRERKMGLWIAEQTIKQFCG